MKHIELSTSTDFEEKSAYSLLKIRIFVLWEELETKKELQKIDSYLKWELLSYMNKSERRLEILFYSLVTKLRLFTIETPEMERLFHQFLSEMDSLVMEITNNSNLDEDLVKAIRNEWFFLSIRNYYNGINSRIRILKNKVRLNQMLAFLYVCENYIHGLEKYYKDMGMSSRVLELYITRMNIKGNRYFFNREYGLYIGFWIFRLISSYGTSFLRLSVTCSLSVIFFGSIYWLADYMAPVSVRMIPDLNNYSSYFFNALVTISGLGIDASPQTALQRFAMWVNTIYGMVVFGMLFNVISTKLSMNS